MMSVKSSSKCVGDRIMMEMQNRSSRISRLQNIEEIFVLDAENKPGYYKSQFQRPLWIAVKKLKVLKYDS